MNAEQSQMPEAGVAVECGKSVPSVPSRRPSSARPRPQARLLEMADRYLAENAFRQAIEMYFEMIEKRSGNGTAKQARERLMGIAEQWELLGKRRQARAIYERLT